MASSISIRDIMTKDVKVVRLDTPIQEVIATMNKFDISAIIVVQSAKPEGIITTRDILSKVVQPSLVPSVFTAKQIMSSPLITINEDATVIEAVKLMAMKKIKKLPVLQDEKLVGLVTFTDIAFEVPTMLSLLEETCRPLHAKPM